MNDHPLPPEDSDRRELKIEVLATGITQYYRVDLVIEAPQQPQAAEPTIL
jgi:hypothetical protein